MRSIERDSRQLGHTRRETSGGSALPNRHNPCASHPYFPRVPKMSRKYRRQRRTFHIRQTKPTGSIAEQTLRTPSIVPLAFTILVHLAHTFLGFGSAETSDKKDRKKFTSMRREDWTEGVGLRDNWWIGDFHKPIAFLTPSRLNFKLRFGFNGYIPQCIWPPLRS